MAHPKWYFNGKSMGSCSCLQKIFANCMLLQKKAIWILTSRKRDEHCGRASLCSAWYHMNLYNQYLCYTHVKKSMDFNLRFRRDLDGYNTRNMDKVVYTNHAVASAELQAAFQIWRSKYITPLQNSDKKPARPTKPNSTNVYVQGV